MASKARLERLRKLVQSDLAALPDRPVPMQALAVSDDDESGGVSLDSPTQPPVVSSKQAVGESPTKPTPAPAESSSDRRFVWLKDAPSSYKPAAMRPPNVPLKPLTNLPATDLQRGDLVSARHHFTPIQALSKYPYKFCNKSHMQQIASAFFDDGKFWKREWDLYYIWDIEPIKPLILIRESQFQELLKEINTHLKLGLRITDAQREEGLVARFPDHSQCLPRYLGRSRSREEYEEMVNATPNETFCAAGEPAHGPPDSRTLEQFKQLMEELWDVQRAKSKATREKKHQHRLETQKTLMDQFKRAQRYLGLRANLAQGHDKSAGPPQPIDPELPAPFEFEKSVVFVCVDVESFERAHHKITEVGVATLDTRDLIGVAPGKDGEGWREKIKARHFRINEHRHLVNSSFVAGHPDGFDFGESTFVSLKDAPVHVATCFRPLFGVHASNTAESDIVAMMRGIDLDEKRNIIFLGHDTQGDVRYLQQLGFDPLKVDSMVETMDTATLFRVWRREQQPTNLGKILYHFDIMGWKLHNAGNDAVYTTQAMLATCVREATIRGSSELENMREEDKATRRVAAHQDAEQRATDEANGWSDNEVNGDGGAHAPLEAR